MSEDLNSLRQMTDKVNELAAEYSALEDALEELNSELSSGNHDIGRILQLKTERRKQMRMIEFEACDMLMSIYPESVDVADLVEDIHENAPTSASEKGVEVAKQLKLSETVIEKISKEKKAIVGWLFEFVRAAINSIS